jgi:alkylhydroperoxidase family enzyme
MLGRSVGLTDDKIANLATRTPPVGVYSEGERVAIEYARVITNMGGIDDEQYAALRAHYSPAEIVEMCFVVGLSNLVNRFHATFRTELDASTKDAIAGVCPLPVPPVDRQGD